MKINIHDVKKAVKTHLKLSNPKIKKLGSGESNTNFLVNNTHIIRVNADYKEKQKVNREYKILKYLNKYNFGPKVYAKDTSKKIIPQDYIIIEYFPGKDLTKKKLSKKMIVDLAKLTATMHSIPIKQKIPSFRRTYKDVKDNIIHLIKLTNKYGGKKEAQFLKKSLDKLNTSGPRCKKTISHGDVCEQNLVYSKNELKFIDFESAGISDPAYDIADIFTGFGKEFKKQHRSLFLKEYVNHRKDSTIRKRIKLFIPLKMFETLCWSIMHVYEIQAGAVSEDIKNKEPIKNHTDYAMYCMKKCRELKLIQKNKIKLF